MLNELDPEILKNYKNLKKEIQKHKTDSEMKYQELLKLKKSNAQMQQMIDNEVATIDSLQKLVSGKQEIMEEKNE